MPSRNVHVVVTGVVQGVGYRAFVAREAGLRGIAGFVRNRRNGTVEAELSGDSVAVEALIAACRAGPPGSKVEHVTLKSLESRRIGPFIVLPTV